MILFEREELEAERKALIADVTAMKRTMKQLEKDLLNKLNSVKVSIGRFPIRNNSIKLCGTEVFLVFVF